MQPSENIEKDNYFLENVGENLRHYRKERSLTQKQTASALSMATITYSLIERGKAGTTLKTLYKIAKLFGISPAQLVCTQDELLFKKSELARYCLPGKK